MKSSCFMVKHCSKKVSKKDTNVLPAASDDDFQTEKVVAKPVSSIKQKAVSDDASASKKKKSKDVVDHSNLDKVREPSVADDPKLVNVAKKVKKKLVSKSLGKKKSEAPSVDSPLEYYFKIDVKKRFAGKPQLYNPYNVIDDFNENLSDDQKELFHKSPIGHFLDVSNFNYQIQLIHLVLLRKIHTERDDVELWFKLGDKAVRFGIEEFSIITVLDCTKSYDVDLFKSKKFLAYKEGIFCTHGLTEKLTVKEVASVFFSGALKDDEDYVKIAFVYFFAGYPQGKMIDNFIFAMVNGDDYIEVFNRFGWGKLLWEKTFHHLKIALKDGNNTFEQLVKKKMIEKSYKLKDFPIAFLIWLYEIIPSLSPRFCKRISNKIPRVLNWENSYTTEFSELIQGVFNNPKEYYFKIDVKKRFVGKPQLYNPYNVIDDINENLSDDQKELFRKSPFGHFLDVSNFNYQIQLIHLVLLRKIHTERDDVELWFKLGDKAVRFGIEELTEKFTVKEVASVFFSGALKDDEDYVKIAFVYFFAGYPQGKKIDNFIFAMVNGDDYIEVFNRFGWGKLLWEKTFHHLKIALKDGNNTFEQLAKKKMIEKGYKLKGFPIAFLIWLYEIIPSLSPRFCKRISNPKVSHGKLDQICVEITSIKECQQQIKDGISSLRIEFLSEFAKLVEIINGLKKKENDGSSKDSEFFSSPIREDISDDGGGLQLSVHTVQAQEEKDTLNFENIFIDPDFLKSVVDSTVKSALKKDDVSFHDDSDKLSLVLYDESYLSPEIQKRQPKPSFVVLSPYVVDFRSSSSSKEDLMRIVQDDKFIVHGINPFKDEIGFNTGAEQCIKFSKFIDENIVMNRVVKKYSDADNILSPPMNFSFIEIFEKMWFYELHACGEFLRDNKVVAEVVSSKKRKAVSDDASALKNSKTKDAMEDSNLKLANVAKKVKKKPVSKSHGKKKTETPAVDAPLKRFAGKPQLYNPFNVIHDINENLSDDQKELFRKSPFGHFLDIHTERDDVELWFKLGNKAVRFGIEDFSLITGLDCKKSYDVDLFKSKKLLSYKEDIFYMHGLTEKVTVREVASVFFNSALKDDEDYVKIALAYFFAGYLYGYPQGKKIDNFIFAMIDGDDFIELAKKMMIEKGYKLKGFLIVFLILLYEIIPSLSPRFCKRIDNKSPRVLDWENSPTSEFSELIQDVFNNSKFDPQYIPKRVDDAVCSDEINDEVKVSQEKLDHICVELNSIKECQQQIKDGISSLRIEFLGEFAKLGEILNGLKKKSDGSSKDFKFFPSPIREVTSFFV
ncbi:hypothetical protein G4B88_029766 [Cannabis sativa]|uniref:DUF1985 domain-containing protein n=1 Tax=Cannabis sativa TaxID=3483 RepID=A0A7J6GEM6_CANSA|nr:hypothetical protein G4B88_029766 [Cannabis sativa]